MTRTFVAPAEEEEAWLVEAACKGVDPDLFFPGRGEASIPVVASAKAVCAGCVVRADCLEWSLSHGEKFGIWGGLTERERRRLRVRRRRVAVAS